MAFPDQNGKNNVIPVGIRITALTLLSIDPTED